ncbi:MAG: hypothetical protein BMS9Abin05_1946 [Rhodothermia bacterium]|nr:MAG: hypothetical protein BMS9Abin05_1946 [Rhodothermia bacterium]
MNSKTLIAAVLGGITLFVLGWLIYGLLLADYFANSASRANPLFLYIGLGELVFGYLIAWVFTQSGTETVADGAKIGATLGFVLALGFGLLMYGTHDLVELSTNLVDALVAAVRYGVAGAVVGWYLGRGASEDFSSESASEGGFESAEA